MAMADGHIFCASTISQETVDYGMVNLMSVLEWPVSRISAHIEDGNFPKSYKRRLRFKNGARPRPRWDIDEIHDWKEYHDILAAHGECTTCLSATC